MPSDEERPTSLYSVKRSDEQAQDISDLNEQLAQYQREIESLTVTTVLTEERERRRIAIGLHDQIGHSLALEALGDQIGKQTRLRAEFERDPVTMPIPEGTALIVYRIVDELVLNILKQANASRFRMGATRASPALYITD